MIYSISQATNSGASLDFSASLPTSYLHTSCCLCLQKSDLTTSYSLGCDPLSQETWNNFLFDLPISSITSLPSIVHVATRVMASKIQVTSKSDCITSLLENCQCYPLTLEYSTHFLLLHWQPYCMVLGWIFHFILATPHGVWNFSSLIMDQTHTPCSGSVES